MRFFRLLSFYKKLVFLIVLGFYKEFLHRLHYRSIFLRILKTKEKMTRLMADMTGQDIEKVKLDVERDYFMSAEEGLAYGIIDEIYHPRNANK